jgi:hypothetical protein
MKDEELKKEIVLDILKVKDKIDKNIAVLSDNEYFIEPDFEEAICDIVDVSAMERDDDGIEDYCGYSKQSLKNMINYLFEREIPLELIADEIVNWRTIWKRFVERINKNNP